MKIVCKNCGFCGKPRLATEGSMLVEIFIWVIGLITIFLLLVALWYSLWRLSSRKKVCKKCLSQNIVPIDTPAGKKLLLEVEGEHCK